MADEQARPLTAEEIAAIRERLGPPLPRGPRPLQYGPDAVIILREELDGLLATLDAWRPVVEAVAHGTVFFESPRGEALLPEQSAHWVDRARRLLGEGS